VGFAGWGLGVAGGCAIDRELDGRVHQRVRFVTDATTCVGLTIRKTLALRRRAAPLTKVVAKQFHQCVHANVGGGELGCVGYLYLFLPKRLLFTIFRCPTREAREGVQLR
jgi:hypothetical protein